MDHPTTLQRVLALAREHLDMDVAWLSRFEDDEQRFTAVSARAGAPAPEPGSATSAAGSYCVRVLDGRLPAVVANSAAEPQTRDLAATRELGIGSYVGAPIRQRDGRVSGMLCCTSTAPSPELQEGQLRTLELLAGLIEELTDAGNGQRHPGPEPVRGSSREPAGGSCCSRSWTSTAAPRPASRRSPASPCRRTDRTPGSPGPRRLAGRDLSRVVIELTEHARVADYDAVLAALAPLRQAGLRVAVDDAGAGYASFGHILRLRPELIKADMSLTRDIDRDPVRQALVSALLTLARTAGARVIAEGVETQAELDTLARLGVPAVQGYLLGRPAESPAGDAGVRVSAHVHQNSSVDLSTLLAEAVRNAGDLASLTRPLLDAVVRITGLETSYLTVLDQQGERLEHRYVRNAGSIALPEGFVLPWSESLCQAMRSGDLLWTGRAGVDLAECAAVEQFGLQTFLSIPVLDAGEQLVGTLCAGSRESVFVSDATLAQVQLVAHVLGGRFAGRR